MATAVTSACVLGCTLFELQPVGALMIRITRLSPDVSIVELTEMLKQFSFQLSSCTPWPACGIDFFPAIEYFMASLNNKRLVNGVQLDL
jgi:hypothetical protein